MKNIIIKVTSLKLILSSFVFAGLISSHTYFEYKNIKSTPKVKTSDTYLSENSKKSISQLNFMQNQFDSLNEKMDYSNPVTKKFYSSILKNTEDASEIIKITALYRNLFTQWRYTNAFNDNISKASESISNGFLGDSEDFAILIASCIRGIGGRSRIVMARNSNTNKNHTYAEVHIADDPIIADELLNEMYAYLENDSNSFIPDYIFYRTDEDGSVWLNLDWGSPTPGAKYFNYTEEFVFFMSDNKYTYNK